MGPKDEQDRIDALIATFPAQFRLRQFPSGVFRFSRDHSYVRDRVNWVVMLYAEKHDSRTGEWHAFAKGLAEEVRPEILSGITDSLRSGTVRLDVQIGPPRGPLGHPVKTRPRPLYGPAIAYDPRDRGTQQPGLNDASRQEEE
jgi:hypothetical protein